MKETENELIKLKLELEKLKLEKTDHTDQNTSSEKDDLIEQLKNEIIHERQIGAHVQFVQEKEIIEKEKEIAFLKETLQGYRVSGVRVQNRSSTLIEKEEDSDTSTFHDALSEGDENDVLLDDLEYD